VAPPFFGLLGARDSSLDILEVLGRHPSYSLRRKCWCVNGEGLFRTTLPQTSEQPVPVQRCASEVRWGASPLSSAGALRSLPEGFMINGSRCNVKRTSISGH
jgi:hypothetical protein